MRAVLPWVFTAFMIVSGVVFAPWLAERLGYPAWVVGAVLINAMTWLAYGADHAFRKDGQGAAPAALLVLLAWSFGSLGALGGIIAFKSRRHAMIVSSVICAVVLQSVLLGMTIARMPMRE